jgi:hypothetical protein
MENKKPLVSIIEINKKGLKQIIMPDSQADDPKFSLELGDEVTLMITARVEAVADVISEDLFNFKKVINTKPMYGFLASVKKSEEIQKEKEEEESKNTQSLFKGKKARVEV